MKPDIQRRLEKLIRMSAWTSAITLFFVAYAYSWQLV